ncbi:beta,beta-carotene 15,15'-dioxygenase [Petromyzon marinus]|uniref:beta,beta-carotene 15,15'-dioxygenase n=1 Tax=Petromyzon marinus TaxID=7757 RepID=UPI003F6F9C0B
METLFQGNAKECPQPVRAELQGKLPEWLSGTLIRNGPALHTFGDTSYNHWFDGMALLHSFTFRGGEVHYRSKYLQSDAFRKNSEANRIVISEFGTMAHPDPCRNVFAKAFSYLSYSVPEFTDNCLINVMRCGEDFYATTETNFMRRIDASSLNTLEKVDYTKYVAINIATSHPHYEPDGTVYNVGTSIADKGHTKYTFIRVPPTLPGERPNSGLRGLEVLCTVPSRWRFSPSYYHSFGLTPRYLVFIEQPLKLDLVKLATAYFRGANWASCMTWLPDDKSRFYLIDRRTGKALSTHFVSEPFVVYHHVNAFERAGCVVCDVVAYDDNSLYDMFYLRNLRKGAADFAEDNKMSCLPQCRRYVLPLGVGKESPVSRNLVTLPGSKASAVKEGGGHVVCTPELIAEGIELPRINYNYNGREYRYIYAAQIEWRPVPTKIVKVDTHTGEKLEWQEGGCWPAEPVFVPTPGARDEDDGVVLSSIVTSEPGMPAFLLVLDARSFREVARATVHGADVPLDLHGLFLPDPK